MPERKRRYLRAAPTSIGQPSEEYKRFESLMKRLVRVPKKVIDERREDERKRA